MNMSFKEKSTWGLLFGIALVSAFYFPAAFRVIDGVPHRWGLFGLSFAAVVALVIVQIVYHAIIAASSRQHLDGDERDKLIDLKAERIGGFVLGLGVIWIVGRIIATTAIPDLGAPDNLAVAVWLIAALTASEFVTLVTVIVQHRIEA